MKTIVLTGFPVWEGESYNSSWDVLQNLELDLPEGWQCRVQRLPGSWAGAPRRLRSCIGPDVKAVVCFGMTGGNTILVEGTASNLVTPGLPDINGKPHMSESVYKTGPLTYLTKLPVNQIIDAVRACGIRCVESFHAGDYLCNFIFYWLMHFTATYRPDVVGGFIHTPPFEMHGGISKSEQCRAVSLIVKTVIAYADGSLDCASIVS